MYVEVVDYDKLSKDQRGVFDKVIERINDNKVIRMFVSGTAGTGKSFLIRALIDALGSEHVFICAPTGLAAKLVNGKTIHSFFNMPIVVQVGECFLKLIIIDEISMCSASMLDKIEEKLSSTRPNNGPFGGYSVIMFGDLLQIPPVEAKWVFESKWWHLFEYAELLTNHRQHQDCEFADMLMRWRVGRLSSSDIKFLETRVIKSLKPLKTDKIADAFINIEKGNSMILVHTNWMADEINKKVGFFLFSIAKLFL
ncbi:hypothetical protein CAEBREN_21960 [Caenorhabditis brenneri]|uniref:ATP-dependent DNA helicase n=1 Tax=Caenorhabditis brenneri TaxID=135651 RepID=G0N198_CAEBE|nr:hypothetical protein CAEBREN_21960 [Caenorhabditis brenneri]